MAWEEESIGQGEEIADEGSSKNRLKLVAIIAVALVVLVAGYYTISFFRSEDKESPPEPVDNQESVDAAEITDKSGDSEIPEESPGTVDLEKFVLYSPEGETNYLLVRVSLQVSNSELENLLTEKSNQEGFQEGLLIQTRFTVLDALSKKTFDQLYDPESLKELGNLIRLQLNDIYSRGKVSKVTIKIRD